MANDAYNRIETFLREQREDRKNKGRLREALAINNLLNDLLFLANHENKNAVFRVRN